MRHAIDPSTGNPAGQFSPTIGGVMVPDSTLDKAFFVGEASGNIGEIQAFDLKKFSKIGSPIMIPNVSESPTRIVRWGNNGLAFITFQGAVYLVGGNFVH